MHIPGLVEPMHTTLLWRFGERNCLKPRPLRLEHAITAITLWDASARPVLQCLWASAGVFVNARTYSQSLQWQFFVTLHDVPQIRYVQCQQASLVNRCSPVSLLSTVVKYTYCCSSSCCCCCCCFRFSASVRTWLASGSEIHGACKGSRNLADFGLGV